ncbi:beta-N-acetylhexosaminidase [Acinetobacter qingfengensis]|uniref:Beta-hexosaminidase n=1 Tax=Acinetobacter qingfengensis TaxID=1262585 RepID=A0A1E7RDX2_9GAMM|nr:beta-N-acetylhexosaminidase [Acinetobacter qingfengensis]KAA8734502.1 beta-N-acetylhexosaminidase [Acinetobacter qingfengensis]OEY97538.1 beta-N-acetylhexosaminidase [Acinetobacter qingfengensis]
MIGALMLDVAGTTLSPEDIEILQVPQVGGLILFARNIESPQQVRALTDHIRQIRPEILIAIDQEGGRVRRLKTEHGFSHIPAMGRFGELFQQDQQQALHLAQTCGWLMATEVLAVGIDFSFAPVLDIDDISDVIGDRGFSRNPQQIIPLARAFMQGMKQAGMATTGKHFPGHGSVKADSHIAAAIDLRSFEEIAQRDMQPFSQLMPELDAIMPAHVIYQQVDPNPAGFSKFWIQTILRKQLGFDGVLFSDDLSMQAACVAGGADARIQAALQAGCDMGLVCNDRQSACIALERLKDLPEPNQQRMERMRGRIPRQNHLTPLNLGQAWQEAKAQIEEFMAK